MARRIKVLSFLVALLVGVSPVEAALPLRVVEPVGTSTLSRDQLEKLVNTYHQAAVIWRTNAELERVAKDKFKGDAWAARKEREQWKHIALQPEPEPECPTRWTFYLTAAAFVAGIAGGFALRSLVSK